MDPTHGGHGNAGRHRLAPGRAAHNVVMATVGGARRRAGGGPGVLEGSASDVRGHLPTRLALLSEPLRCIVRCMSVWGGGLGRGAGSLEELPEGQARSGRLFPEQGCVCTRVWGWGWGLRLG